MNDTFYFLAYVNNRKAITVIDLSYNVMYERDEWDEVNLINFDDHLEAISYARSLSTHHNLEYVLFESRYNKDLNEYLEIPRD